MVLLAFTSQSLFSFIDFCSDTKKNNQNRNLHRLSDIIIGKNTKSGGKWLNQNLYFHFIDQWLLSIIVAVRINNVDSLAGNLKRQLTLRHLADTFSISLHMLGSKEMALDLNHKAPLISK